MRRRADQRGRAADAVAGLVLFSTLDEGVACLLRNSPYGIRHKKGCTTVGVQRQWRTDQVRTYKYAAAVALALLGLAAPAKAAVINLGAGTTFDLSAMNAGDVHTLDHGSDGGL
jgi:hypothetical protein